MAHTSLKPFVATQPPGLELQPSLSFAGTRVLNQHVNSEDM